MQNLKPLFDSPARIVISHGNGPQIGSLLIQQAKSNSDTTPAMPLDTLWCNVTGYDRLLVGN